MCGTVKDKTVKKSDTDCHTRLAAYCSPEIFYQSKVEPIGFYYKGF